MNPAFAVNQSPSTTISAIVSGHRLPESWTKTSLTILIWSAPLVTIGSQVAFKISYFKFIIQYKFNSYVLTKGDLLFNYQLYKDQTTSLLNVEYVPVSSVYECASKCDSSTTAPCRSFNFCKLSDTYICAISENHFNSTDKNPEAIYSPICDHYSSNISTARVFFLTCNGELILMCSW